MPRHPRISRQVVRQVVVRQDDDDDDVVDADFEEVK